MGLDIAETFMEIEERFSIWLPEELAPQGKLAAVRDLVDYTERAIRQSESLSAKEIANSLEKNLLEKLNSNRLKWIRPKILTKETDLKSITAPRHYQKLWSIFWITVGPIPPLKRNMGGLLTVIWIAAATAVLLAFSDHFNIWGWCLYCISPLILFLLNKYVLCFLLRFPNEYKTIDDLIEKRAQEEWTRFHAISQNRNSESIWSREEIQREIIAIIHDITGIKMEKITLDSRLVEDLGMG
ncbi:MAG: hypothetical protein Q4G69_08730 [Planctomycetia bacterium]|nr:hypothetical protein [Planctomycetia bacterium]